MNTVDIETQGGKEIGMLKAFIATGPVERPVELYYIGHNTVRIQYQNPISLVQIGMAIASFRNINDTENKVKAITTYLEEQIRPLKERSSREAELVEATLTNTLQHLRSLP